ncbi:hypothetical protein [Corticicoccus populi]|uniref:Uncharacterized protein n=1 Tax=Corticicoccus populi TaxID=1812821 RepID=A0ABW5WVL5_9STAP
MSFFKQLTWDNRHMDLRFEENKYDGKVTITKVYDDDEHKTVDLNVVNENYSDELKSARGTILANRLGMLIAFSFFVFLPALILSVIEQNVLLIGAVIVYSVLAYFIIECINQVIINDVLQRIDHTFSK